MLVSRQSPKLQFFNNGVEVSEDNIDEFPSLIEGDIDEYVIVEHDK